MVSVFVATSNPASIHVSVYDGVVDAANPPAEHAAADGQTTRFGARFHAAVITVNVADAASLMAGHRYSYDLRITPSGGAAQTLKDLGLLKDDTIPGYGKSDPGPNQPPPPPPTEAQIRAKAEVEICAIGYADGQLPSFVTCPASLDELIIAHASCRRPHAPGTPVLQSVDDLIDDLQGADAGRPHMLFLTGDQIYADDVAAALLPGLNTLAIALISDDAAGVEQIVSPAGGGPFNVTTTVLPAGFRQKLTGVAGFTSEEAACHLLGFGEWLAMYCIAWNPYLWPVLAVADLSDPGVPADLKNDLQQDAIYSPDNAPRTLGRPTPDAANDVITPLYGAPQVAHDALHDAFQAFLTDKATLDDFRREVPKVRRLLANVPTYMIGDDHEVTDDWFMTGGIRAANTSKPFGRALLRNAMSAYAVCQAWGNDPVLWAANPQRQALLTGIAEMFGGAWNGGPPLAAACDKIELALGLSPTGQPQFDFSFSVDGPVHRVRVLDTRTRRQYLTPSGPPGLLTQAALDQQLPEETLPDGHVLIVVSPAPVFGPPMMTELGGPMAASEYDIASFARDATDRALEQNLTGIPNGRPLGAQFYDAEHWGVQPAAFERLLARLSHFPRVVVLGGDVHYGAAYAMDWSGGERNSRIVHFTSSAARNLMSSKTLGIYTLHNLMLLNGMSIGLQRIGMPMTRLGWSATLPAVVDDLSSEPPLARIRVQTGPVLLSDDLFRKPHALTRPPEWLWQANPIFDTRAPADRPLAARAVGVDTELPNDISAVRHYADLVTAHVLGLDTVAIARGIQFLNNIGVIRFATAGDGLHVSQSLYSLRARPQPNEKADAYVVHDARLEPIAVPVPTSIGPGG